MRLFLIASCVVVGAASCGGSSSGGGPETLTCDWLAGPTNCWTNVALTATTCLPPATDQGLFNANNSSCAYGTGEVVTFTPPLVLPASIDTAWNFTIADANGQQCLRYQDAGTALTLVVGGQTVSETIYGSMGMRITCPDGTSVQTANAFALLNCPNALDGIPGIAWAGFDTSVSTTLLGTGATELPLFDCSK